jgi:hypothetical protein
MKEEKKEKPTTAKATRTMKQEKKEKPTTTKAKRGSSAKINMDLDRWNVRLEECKQYREEFGHCKIPTAYKDNKSLGIWVQEMRRNFKLLKQGKEPRYKLTDEQIEMLDQVDFHWGWTPDPTKSAETDSSWESNFAKLQEYQTSHGSFDMEEEDASTTTGSSSISLDKWTRVQRNQYKKREQKIKTFMTKDRIKKLNGIGFNWDGPRKID